MVAPAAGLLSGYLGSASPATAQQVGSNAQQLMSTYAASVIAPALQAGQQQLALANQGIAGQANNVGAFGGTRQGVQEGVAEAQTALGTQQNIASMLNTGWNSALTPATSLATNASAQGYNAATGLAGMLGTGYQNAQAAGQGLANQNLASGLTAAAQLPTQATNQANLGQSPRPARCRHGSGTAQQELPAAAAAERATRSILLGGAATVIKTSIRYCRRSAACRTAPRPPARDRRPRRRRPIRGC